MKRWSRFFCCCPGAVEEPFSLLGPSLLWTCLNPDYKKFAPWPVDLYIIAPAYDVCLLPVSFWSLLLSVTFYAVLTHMLWIYFCSLYRTSIFCSLFILCRFIYYLHAVQHFGQLWRFFKCALWIQLTLTIWTTMRDTALHLVIRLSPHYVTHTKATHTKKDIASTEKKWRVMIHWQFIESLTKHCFHSWKHTMSPNT